jgi:hypothetical protein
MAVKTINPDPFAEVNLVPVKHGNVDTDKVFVELQDPEGNMQPLAGLNTVHSKGYKLITNQAVHDMAGDILSRTGKNFQPLASSGGKSGHIYWDGAKRFSAKWYCTDIAESLPGGHAMAMGVEVLNSYDGSFPVGIKFFAMNLLCANQFYANNLFGNFVFRHTEGQANVFEDVPAALSSISQQADSFLKLLPEFKRLQETKVDGLDGYLGFRDGINERGWNRSKDADVLDELHQRGITSRMKRTQTASTDNLWGVLNAYTAVATHVVGGFSGSGLSNLATQYALASTGRAAVA